MFHHQQLAAQVQQFLNCALNGASQHVENLLAPRIRCWGFPDFDPTNRAEYQGFFNYLIDVFAQRQWRIEPLLASDSQVLVRFCITGLHHEEFMGLPATGAHLEFSANILFRLRDGAIEESWMYKKSLSLTTKKGSLFEMIPAVTTHSAHPQTARKLCSRR